MANRVPKSEIKRFFETGDKPTEEQFGILIDECYNDGRYAVLVILTYGVAPSEAELNDYYIDAVQNKLYRWDGEEWVIHAGDISLLYKTKDTSLVYVFDGTAYKKLGSSDLIPGANITIVDSVISADDMRYNDAEVRGLINTKRDKITDASKIYATDGSSNQVGLSVGSGLTVDNNILQTNIPIINLL